MIDTGTAGNQPGLELDATTGTFAVSQLRRSHQRRDGRAAQQRGHRDLRAGEHDLDHQRGAPGLSAALRAPTMGTSTFDEITVTGSGAGGVSMTNTHRHARRSATSSLTTTGGTAALRALNAGTVSVPAAGTANVSATGGPAVDVTGTARRHARLRRRQLDQQRRRRHQHRRSGHRDLHRRRAARSPAPPASPSTSTAAAATITYPGTIANGARPHRRHHQSQRQHAPQRQHQRHTTRRRRHQRLGQHRRHTPSAAHKILNTVTNAGRHARIQHRPHDQLHGGGLDIDTLRHGSGHGGGT